MSETLNVAELREPLEDITNAANAANAARQAREKGWVEPSSYDYEEYGKPSQEARPVDPEAPIWGHNAQKYEWQEEYGEVGPRNEALEQMLFHSELITRQGLRFEQYVVFRFTADHYIPGSSANQLSNQIARDQSDG